MARHFLVGKRDKKRSVSNNQTVDYADTNNLSTNETQALDYVITRFQSAVGGALWDKAIAIYPFLGNTAAKQALNIKNVGGGTSFNITWNGTITHSTTGANGDGSSGYGDTGINPNTHLQLDNCSMFYYSREDNAGTSEMEMGYNSSGSDGIYLASNYNGTLGYFAINGQEFSVPALKSDGLIGASRTNSTEVKVYRNGARIHTIENNSGSRISQNLWVLGGNNTGVGKRYSDRECAFAWIGQGLTEAEVSTLYDIVSKYNDAYFSRAVYDGSDTVSPINTSVSVNTNVINLLNIDIPFKVTAVYSETMDTSSTPDITFIPPVNGLTLSSGRWISTNLVEDTYEATFEASNQNELLEGIDIMISGADDASGNRQVAYTEQNLFSIDTETQNPTLLTLTTLKAFPTAYGGGSNSQGGRGGKVYKVNTLDRNAPKVYDAPSDSYSGGLYAALQHTADPLYIVFDVSGNIDVGVGGTSTQFFSVNAGNFSGMPNVRQKSVFGQTAPNGGITMTGGAFRFGSRFYNNSHDIIFRHFRSRPVFDKNGVKGSIGTQAADDSFTNGIHFNGGNKIIIDHMSVAFSYDKGILLNHDELTEGAGDTMFGVTVQKCLVATNHTNCVSTVNPGASNNPEDNMGRISWLKNAMIGSNRTPNIAFNGEGEVKNNLIYEPRSKMIRAYHAVTLNHMNNAHIKTANLSSLHSHAGSATGGSQMVSIYTNGNSYEGYNAYSNANSDNKTIWTNFTDRSLELPANHFSLTEHNNPNIPNPLPLKLASEIEAELITAKKCGAHRFIDDSGNRITFHDPYDDSLFNRVSTRTTHPSIQIADYVLPVIPSNTRPAGYDSDVAGIPNWFSTQHGITSYNQIILDWDFGNYQVKNNAGYTAIEMYAAWVAKDFEELLGI